MLKNYLKITLRNLYRHKLFSGITILGLAVGFTCFILIFFYVQEEMTYDRFHQPSDRMYRLIQHIEDNGNVRKVATVAPRVGVWAYDNIPEVEAMTRLVVVGRMTVGNELSLRDYEHIFIADSNFLQFFNFPLLKGDPARALTDASGIVVTRKTAQKYFDAMPALGTDLYNNLYESQLSGILEDIPVNSHLQFELLVTEKVASGFFPWWDSFMATDWTSNAFITYLQLAPGTDIEKIENMLQKEAQKHYDDGKQVAFTLQPLHDIHFHSAGIEGGINVGANKLYYIYLFLSIGIIVLLLACFNYMNLSTTAAIKRSREIGLRKTVGAGRWQLLLQFLSEAVVIALIALMLSLAFVFLLLPYLNDLTGKNLQNEFTYWQMLAGLLVLTVFTGLLSGLYPSLIAARISPARSLKGNFTTGQKFTIRKVLVVSQFAVAITMIVSTLIIYNQLNYLREKDLGFSADNLVVIDINSGSLRSNFEAIKTEMLRVPGVEGVTVSSRVPGEWKVTPEVVAHLSGADKDVKSIFLGADQDFLATFGINLLTGRNFKSIPADSLSVLINQAAVDAFGIENPVGANLLVEQVNWNGNLEDLQDPRDMKVIGVVEDFTFESLKDELQPMIIGFRINPIQNIDYFTVKINSPDLSAVIAGLSQVNNSFDQENPMEYHFLDEQLNRFYQTDQQRGKLFLTFSAVVILLSCMGLFALASYMTSLRIKEVGIRKILGAEVVQILILLSRDFAFLILMAFVLAIPVSYFTMRQWLDDFAYKIEISWWYFLLAGIGVLTIALLTIASITFKASSANPVNALKNE